MNNIDWNNIIKLKEYTEFLRTDDLIQLSMSSKKLRNNFAKDTLNTLNLRSFRSSGDYSSLFIKEGIDQFCNKINLFINPYKPLNRELIESKKEFSNDLKLLYGNPKKLILNDYVSYQHLLNEIPSIFPNITTLVFKESEFTLDTFQYLLDNFKCLENLELTDNLIFHNTEISIDYTTTYPTSLKSLKLRDNRVMMVYDKVNPISINEYKHANEMHSFYGTYQHLPNLVTFDHDSELLIPEEGGDLFMFIRLNPQLESLKLSGFAFNFELFDIIKDYKNLTHFEFNCNYYWKELEEYEMPVLYNIKHLHVKTYLENIDEIFIGNFPNVNDLIIDFSGCIDNSKFSLIESFPNLKSLKLISDSMTGIQEDLTFPKLNYLEKIEFYLYWGEEGFEKFKWDVSTCDRLKSVSFTKYENYSPFKGIELTEELAKHWDFCYFPHKLVYHKKP